MQMMLSFTVHISNEIIPWIIYIYPQFVFGYGAKVSHK